MKVVRRTAAEGLTFALYVPEREEESRVLGALALAGLAGCYGFDRCAADEVHVGAPAFRLATSLEELQPQNLAQYRLEDIARVIDSPLGEALFRGVSLGLEVMRSSVPPGWEPG